MLLLICKIDMCKREYHPTPTVNEMIGDLNGAKVFSKLDLNHGHNQLELAEESLYITTFNTHQGYKQMNFSISSATEIFQDAIRQALDGMKSALNISDDNLVYSRNQKEHNEIPRAAFQRLRENSLTVNKCVYSKDSLKFFGYHLNLQEIASIIKILPWVPEACLALSSLSYYTPLTSLYIFSPLDFFDTAEPITISLIRKHPESGCFADWLLMIS